MSNQMQHLGAIQSLRAVAAIMVVVHHLAHELRRLPGGAGPADTLGALVPWMAGVDIFFVISGFIMVHASASLFGRKGGAAAFMTRRLIRIVPIYWLMTAAVVAIARVAPGAVSGGLPGWSQIVTSLLFLPFARPDGVVQPVLSLGWTLNFEMLFYGLFAVAMMLARSAAMVVAVTCLLLLGVLLLGAMTPALPFAFWGQPIIVEFALGMVLGLGHRVGLRLPDTARVVLLVAGVMALVLAPRLGGQTGWSAVIFQGLPGLALVAACALGRSSRDAASPPALERLGDASYALYLSHPLALKAVAMLFAVGGLPMAAYPPVALAACILLAFMLHRWFETPVTAWLRARATSQAQAGV